MEQKTEAMHPAIRPIHLGRVQLAYIERIRHLRKVIHGHWGPAKLPPDELPKSRRESGPYRLPSGLTVAYRPFQDSDSTGLSRILQANRAQLALRMGHHGRRLDTYYSPENLPWIAQWRDYHVLATMDGKALGVMGFWDYSATHTDFSDFSMNQDYHGKGLGTLLAALSVLRKIQDGFSKFYCYAGPMSQGIFLRLGLKEGLPFIRLISEGTILSLAGTVSDGLAVKAAAICKEILGSHA